MQQDRDKTLDWFEMRNFGILKIYHAHILLSTGLKLGSPWLESYSYNHRLRACWVGAPLLRTRSSTNNGGCKLFILIHKVLEQPRRNVTSPRLWKLSQIPHPSPRLTSTSNRTKTDQNWLNRLQTLHTH